MVRMSYPSSRRCLAKEWRTVWQVACLASPVVAAAALTTRWRIDGTAQWPRRDGDAGARTVGGHTRLSARLGSGALSLADPMEPPPSIITGRSNGLKGTPGPLGLSRGPPDSCPQG